MSLCACMYANCAKAGRCLARSGGFDDRTDPLPRYWPTFGGVVFVCPIKDIECGSRPANWCNECPLRKSEAAVQNQEQQREPIAHSETDEQEDFTVTPQKRPEEAPKERE
jgi:hypothetical protein